MPIEEANDEGSDPTKDIEAQNPSGTTSADKIDADDPHKVEKLANSGDDSAKADATE